MDHRKPNPDLYGIPFVTDEFRGMPYLHLGRSGLRVSKVGLGTWKMGYPETGDGARSDEKTSLAILDKAAELGVTLWDTANRYNSSSGNSERIIGTWLENNPDSRRDVVIATKIFGGMDGVTPNHSRAGRLNIIESVNACTERLCVDYIDLLYFHKFDERTPVEESLATIEDLVSAGVVRHFAVSNFTRDQLELYRETEKSLSVRCRVTAVQNKYDILGGEREEAAGVLDWCAAVGASFVAYSPLARGLLTGRYLDPAAAKKGDRLFDEGTLKDDASEAKLAKLKALGAIAAEAGLELSQLALAYMLTLPGMGPVIPTATKVEQVESNAHAGKVELGEEVAAKVKAVLEE